MQYKANLWVLCYFCGMARILALDYGMKRTGIAVTDPLQMIASGLTTVETHQLLDFLSQYCKTEPVERMVIGLPTREDGSATQMSLEVERFIEKLQKRFPEMEILRRDERYTSRDASMVIFAAGVKKKKRQEKGLTDKVAAAIILQQYMEECVWSKR
jgi:putative holliday junction resolvase